MKDALPQIMFLVVLVFNFFSSLVDSNRNSWASFFATLILLTLTYLGGFYAPLFDLLAIAPKG